MSSCLWVRVMVFNTTFNNISVISWQSVLLVEETVVPWENHQPAASHWQTLSHNERDSNSQHYCRISAGFYYTKVKWSNSYKFLRPFILKGTYSIGQLCTHLPKTYRSFNGILKCGLIHLMQLELNLTFICFKLAYLLWYLELTTRQVFQRSPSFQVKLSLSENK